MNMRSMKLTSRNGLSIIEVLTAIVVALVGVAGVMILIPFAVDQAKIGFDQEISYRHGANAASEYELKGFGDRQRWTIDAPSVATRTARCYMIDPIRVTDRADQGFTDHGSFPMVDPGLLAGLPTHDRTIYVENVNLTQSIAPFAPFNTLVARHHFMWRDDLQVTEPRGAVAPYVSPDVAPPQQIFDQNNAAVPVRRQSLGEMSVRVLVVPDRFNVEPALIYPANPNLDAADQVFETRNYFIVEKTRPKMNSSGSPRQPYERIYQVDHPLNQPTYDPNLPQFRNARIAFGGGTLILRETAGGTLTHNNLQTANNLSTQRQEIRRGDWIALTNVYFDYDTNRYRRRINFYLVDDATFVTAGPGHWQVTLRGPDFDFGWAYVAPNVPQPVQDYSTFGEYIATGAPLSPSTPSRTYAIHLPNVWAVFEKTYREPN